MTTTPSAPVAAVELLEARKQYARVQALRGVSLTIERGEVVAMLGPNGAGKTTAISLMLGMRRPTAGHVRLFGRDPGDRAARSRCGVMLQESGVTDVLRVAETVDIFRGYYPRPLPTARVLELAGLAEVANRKISALSGGQRQRLYYALAVCGNPEALFLDEPTAGMDVEARRSFLASIREYAAEGRTVVLTTHYLEEADSLCDRIAIVDHGRIVKIGSPDELKASIGGDVLVVGVAEAEPDISEDIKKIPLVREVKKNGHEYRIKSEAGEESSIKVIDLIRSKGLHVTKISLTKPTLDEAYLEFTGRSIREEESNKMDAFKQRVTMMRARR